jgi:hypothetical protein
MIECDSDVNVLVVVPSGSNRQHSDGGRFAQASIRSGSSGLGSAALRRPTNPFEDSPAGRRWKLRDRARYRRAVRDTPVGSSLPSPRAYGASRRNGDRRPLGTQHRRMYTRVGAGCGR